jgi:lon-related putative ATP-dependent protease
VRQVLEARARATAPPCDWVYVNDFADAHRPRALSLPRGRAARFADDMAATLAELRAAIPSVFESDEYRTRRQAVEEEFKERQEGAFNEVQEEARKRGLALLRTPTGLALAPMQNDEVMPPDVFHKLPPPVRKQIEQDIAEMQERLMHAIEELPQWQSEYRRRLRELTQEVTQVVVASVMRGLQERYADLENVSGYLEAAAQDIAQHVDLFLPSEGGGPAAGLAGMANPFAGQMRADAAREGALTRYKVNALVADGPEPGAPVIAEDLPTLPNLVGRVEYQQEFGALTTDFTQIIAGALHRANGGYLVLDALKLLQQPLAWDALKRALQARRIKIESPAQMLSMISTVSLEPEPIPLDVKVVLIGERHLYYLLSSLDPDFNLLFKVAVDFEEELPRHADNALAYARLIATQARHRGLRALHRPAVARVLEHASRLADDAERFSLAIGRIDDLLREANHFAGEAGHKLIERADVEQAIAAQIRRADRIRERSHELILRETVLIDTDGEAVGQINGLAVLSVGNFTFARPSRISARVRIGSGEVVDIERRVELGGPIHSKGVMILSSFLGARYAMDRPLSLTASLVFEQSYGGVDGDSASSTELYALLSALAGLPIRQSLAVTGSVNQFGRVQAIGGVNEKIEGFFDICRGRGLTGRQGVLIPEANVKHLMLREDVVVAARAGRFHVYPVASIDEGIELLTGTPAGASGKGGGYPSGTVNRMVQDRLAEFAEQRRRFGARADGERANGRNGRPGAEG